MGKTAGKPKHIWVKLKKTNKAWEKLGKLADKTRNTSRKLLEKGNNGTSFKLEVKLIENLTNYLGTIRRDDVDC